MIFQFQNLPRHVSNQIDTWRENFFFNNPLINRTQSHPVVYGVFVVGTVVIAISMYCVTHFVAFDVHIVGSIDH
jgi:hypothetical protein